MSATPVWPTRRDGTTPGFWYGADYNPEQWDAETWDEDIRLMQRAGVNIVSVGIFSWGALQPAPDTWTFDWLDDILDRLAAAGISVDLATATASPPPWLTQLHPEILPVEADGTVVGPGARLHWRPTSAVFKRYALALVEKMAMRYRDHPALVAWHAANEYGWNNRLDYSPDAERAFQRWCQLRFGTVEELNRAWGTSFWSHQVSDFNQIEVPRYAGPSLALNPAHVLDFKRFSSDALRDFYLAEKSVLNRLTPGIPVTTNFMVSYPQSAMDYEQWVDHVDFVSNDHYFTAGDLHVDELGFTSSLMSQLSRDRGRWFLMEQSTSAVSWRGLNHRLHGAQMLRDSLVHIGSGADALCFFQWRQSRSGAERFHSAMLPLAGATTEIYGNTVKLGQLLGELSEMERSVPLDSEAAVVFDYQSEWALEDTTLPNNNVDHWSEALGWYRALLDHGVRADVVPFARRWEDHKLVVFPAVYLMSEELSRRIRKYVAGGGVALVTCVSGLANEFDRLWPGGAPAPLSSTFGISIEEFEALGRDPQAPGAPETAPLDTGVTAVEWADVVGPVAADTEVLSRFSDTAPSGLMGRAAITRRRDGEGQGIYVGCRFSDNDRSAVVPMLLRGTAAAGLLKPAEAGILEFQRADATRKYRVQVARTGQTPVSWAGTVMASRGLREDNPGQGHLDPDGYLVTSTPNPQ